MNKPRLIRCNTYDKDISEIPPVFPRAEVNVPYNPRYAVKIGESKVRPKLYKKPSFAAKVVDGNAFESCKPFEVAQPVRPNVNDNDKENAKPPPGKSTLKRRVTERLQANGRPVLRKNTIYVGRDRPARFLNMKKEKPPVNEIMSQVPCRVCMIFIFTALNLIKFLCILHSYVSSGLRGYRVY